MAFSSLPEVGGDAVLFADKLSVAGLATPWSVSPRTNGSGAAYESAACSGPPSSAGRKQHEPRSRFIDRPCSSPPNARSVLAGCWRANPALVPALIIRTVGRSRSTGRCSDDVSIAGCAQRLARVECRSEREDTPRAETLQARQGSRDVLTSRGRRPPSARGKHRTPTGPSLRRAPITSHSPTLRRSRSRHHRRDMDARTKPSRLWPNRPGPQPGATALRVKRLRILNNPPHECRR